MRWADLSFPSSKTVKRQCYLIFEGLPGVRQRKYLMHSIQTNEVGLIAAEPPDSQCHMYTLTHLEGHAFLPEVEVGKLTTAARTGVRSSWKRFEEPLPKNRWHRRHLLLVRGHYRYHNIPPGMFIHDFKPRTATEAEHQLQAYSKFFNLRENRTVKHHVSQSCSV